jgi:hypothetical protein
MKNRFNLLSKLLVIPIILGGIFYFTKSTSTPIDGSVAAVKSDTTTAREGFQPDTYYFSRL